MGGMLTRLLAFCVAAGCGLSAGCRGQDDKSAAIMSEQASYTSWLLTRVPVLTNMPPGILYDYDFTTLVNASRTRPIISYYLKAGNWDGLIDVTFVINVDPNNRPLALAERRVSFIRLPARRVVRAEGGRLRNLYYGVTLWPNDMESVVERLKRRDSFQDLCTRADRGNEMVYSRFQDTDDWEKLGKDLGRGPNNKRNVENAGAR